MNTKTDKNTIVINLLAGPGCGKSTTAGGLFYHLKRYGVEAEYVEEYAKDRVWENALDTLSDQIYVFGKQQHRMFRLKGKVDIIVTDSPLILSILYDKTGNDALRQLVLHEFHEYNNLTFLLKRDVLYRTDGRLQTESEAKEIDDTCRRLLEENEIPYMEVNASTAVEKIYAYLVSNHYIDDNAVTIHDFEDKKD